MSVDASGIVTAASGGFTYRVTSGLTLIQFGIELRNRSSQMSAVDVDVEVTFSDDRGHATDTAGATLTGVPAGGTFAFGGTSSPLGSAPNEPIDWVPLHMRVRITTGGTSSTSLVLPDVSNISMPGTGSRMLSGVMSNPYAGSAGEQWAGQYGTLYVVYLDAHGQFVGEDVVNLEALDLNNGDGIAPGARATFTLTAPIPAGATSATASVDPCAGRTGSGLTSCPARSPSRQ